MTYRILPAFCAGLLLLAGSFACSSGTPERSVADERKLIEEAIDRHLAKRSDLDFSTMGVTVDRVNLVGDDQAEAVVRFQVGEDADTSIEMEYALQRKDEVWEVAGPPKGTGSGLPAAPPAGEGVMPADHPPLGGAAQELPSGHPPVN